MDNREAIKILNQYDMNFYRDDGSPIPAEQIADAVDLAIAALEQQEKAFDEWCTDCKEYDKEQHCCHRFTKVIRQAVEDHRGEWSDGKWTAVSEALPEDYTDVLAWFEYFRYGDYNCMYQTYGIGTYSARYDSWMINHESGWHKLRVIAWRPLPEPYQEDKA